MKRANRHVQRRRLKQARADNGYNKLFCLIVRRFKGGLPVPQSMTDALRALVDQPKMLRSTNAALDELAAQAQELKMGY